MKEAVFNKGKYRKPVKRQGKRPLGEKTYTEFITTKCLKSGLNKEWYMIDKLDYVKVFKLSVYRKDYIEVYGWGRIWPENLNAICVL